MFCNFAKNSKIQNGRHFLREIFFLKIGMATLQRYPVGQKFRRNRSIWHGFRDISIFMFCNFSKIRKFKMAAIFCEKFFFGKLAWLLCRDTLWVKNFVEIALSSRVFEI